MAPQLSCPLPLRRRSMIRLKLRLPPQTGRLLIHPYTSSSWVLHWETFLVSRRLRFLGLSLYGPIEGTRYSSGWITRLMQQKLNVHTMTGRALRDALFLMG